MEAIINYLDKYSAQIFVLQMGLLVILTAIIFWVYYLNRKKYHNLKHQIPASVVKNYLDSIIQNSNALKSSLFRGGGLDVDPSSIPSVMPVDKLQTSTPISISLDGQNSSAANGAGDEALKAEIARLQSQLMTKDSVIKDLESKNTDLEGVVKQKQERIEELEALLAKASESNGDSGVADALNEELAKTKAERDNLKEELEQYSIIEDDLADLKRLRQENEQLKASLAGGEPVASEPAPEPVAEPEPAPPAEEPAAVAEPEAAVEEPVAEEAVAAAPEEPAGDAPAEEDKSPEDLLSEFEKMLG